VFAAHRGQLDLVTTLYDENTNTEANRLLAREILEHAALFSIKARDTAAFERFIAQLKSYYFDEHALPRSQREYLLLGLNLLNLLSQNRIAEFHVELEVHTLALRSIFKTSFFSFSFFTCVC
jgi:hypothetical protein